MSVRFCIVCISCVLLLFFHFYIDFNIKLIFSLTENISVGKSDPSNEETIEWKLPVVVAAAVLAIVLLAIIVFLVIDRFFLIKTRYGIF